MGMTPGTGFRSRLIELKHHAVLAGGEIRRQRSFVFTLKFGDHVFKSGADKPEVHFGFGKMNAILRQQGDIDIHRYFFTVDENAIAIKNDVGDHGWPRCSKGCDDLLIDRLLEGHDEIDDLVHFGPAPLVEFLLVAGRRQVDFAVVAE